MRLFRWLSEWSRRLSARERRVVLGGVAVSATLLVATLWLVPLARAWRAREAGIAARADQLARLEALVAREPALRATSATRDRNGAPPRGRLLAGDTPAVAASALQLLIKRYADQSRVLLERTDVAVQAQPASDGLTPVPVQLAAQGDLSGLVDLLFYLQNGRELLVLDELRVSAPSEPPRAGVQRLTWTIRLHGFFAPSPMTS